MAEQSGVGLGASDALGCSHICTRQPDDCKAYNVVPCDALTPGRLRVVVSVSVWCLKSSRVGVYGFSDSA